MKKKIRNSEQKAEKNGKRALEKEFMVRTGMKLHPKLQVNLVITIV